MGFGGFLGSSGAKKAAKVAKDALKFQKKVYAENKERLAPFIDVGAQSIADLGSRDFRNREFYQFREEELNRAIRRGLSLRGNFFSGAGLEAEARGNMQLSGEQIQNEQNLLLSLAELGNRSAISLGQLGNQSAAGVTQASGMVGNAQITRGQLLGQGIDQLTGSLLGAGLSLASFGQSQSLVNAQSELLGAQAGYYKSRTN